MFNCLLIGYNINNKIDTKRAFMAAYIHDMSRKCDGRCLKHGIDSSNEKLPLYKELFKNNKITDDDIEAIKLSVYNHSDYEEIEKSNPYYKTVAILRDADGLDLCRMDIKIQPRLLRFPESVDLIKTTENLFIKTDYKNYNSFIQYLNDALKII